MLMEMSLCFFHLVLKQVNETRTNETRHIEWHKTCKRKCKFGANVCNNKQRWNKDKCRCECKELIDKECVIKDLFGILVIVSVNVMKRVMLENI